MAAVVTQVDAASGGVRIDWIEPYDNEQPITQYVITIQTADGSDWLQELTYCDGSLSELVTGRTCIVPMSVLITAPYNYAFRETVKVRARAYNSYGWAEEYSPANEVGATVRVIPTPMGPISVNAVETTITQITVYWSMLTTGEEIGDSVILSYNLQWDQGLGGADEADWADLIGNPIDSLDTAFTVATNVAGGEFYKFRVRASNIYGFGDFSAVAALKASQEPQQVTSASIATTNDLLAAVITWDEPFDNYDDITAYLIELRHSDGVTFSESAECDGQQTDVAQTRQCSVLLTTLIAAPYSLQLDDWIVARVQPYNSFGWGVVSQPNTGGAQIQTQPGQMPAPTYIDASSSIDQVTVQIDALSTTTETGGYPIDSYHFEYFDGSSWASIQGQDGSPSLLTVATIAGLVAG